MAILRLACGIVCNLGGDQHSGWLPRGAAIPLPTPIRRVTLDVWIESEGPGFLLIAEVREGEGSDSDSWFDTLADAELAAAEWFGIEPGRWEVSLGLDRKDDR